MTEKNSKLDELTNALDNLSGQEILDFYAIMHARADQTVSEALKRPSLHDIRSKGGAHSMVSMIEMLPTIWGELAKERRGQVFSWLDVGPGAAYGTGLLADLYSGKSLGYTLDVSTIDIRGGYKNLISMESPNIKNHIVGDLFKLDLQFDYVSCSHVIEHVPDPVNFVKRLQEIASKRVFILTPWKEREDILTKGHCNIFNEKFIEELGNPEYRTYRSIAWGAFLKPPYEVLFLNLPGLAKG